MKLSILRLATAAGVVLAPMTAFSYSVFVLESFEENIDNVAPIGDRGGAGNVRLTHYTKEHDFDTRVTEGNHALKVELLNDHKGWSEDFMVTLSAEAAAVLQAAWDPHPVTGEKPEARYLLKYDVTFPPGGVVMWMNQGMHNNWEPFQEYDTPGGDTEPVTVAVPLDLLPGSLVLNEDGTASLRFIHNADWSDGNVPEFYIDNIRLVDQWIAEAPPVTTVIESFEAASRISEIVVETDRVTVEEYVATGPDDPNVTHGSRSLKVTLLQQGWGEAFMLDLSEIQELSDLLWLSDEERARYTFRFDAVFQPMPDGGWGGDDWGYKFGTSIGQADTARMPSNRASYSVNLATANFDPFFPLIHFVGNGGFAGEVVTYFDNFRILDTHQEGPALIFPPVPHEPPPGTAPMFTGISFDAAADQLNLTWEGEAGRTYRLVSSTDLINWDTVVADNYPEGGAPQATVSITIPVNPADQVLFFQVVAIQ